MIKRLSAEALLSRRRALSTLGALTLVGCGGGSGDSSSSSSASSSSSSSSSSASTSSSSSSTSTACTPTRTLSGCAILPTETIGPYPLYSGVVSNSALWRQDITEGKTGVPLTLYLTLLNANNNCAPLQGHDIYIWHCDKDGLYSGYSNGNNAGQEGLTYLRGVQTTDTNGLVTFNTIYPGWYAGRITHIHFRVFLSSTSEAISQIAFPQDVTQTVYSSSLYTHGQNTSVTSFAADNVFSDGTTYQMADICGSVANGYSAALTIGINA